MGVRVCKLAARQGSTSVDKRRERGESGDRSAVCVWVSVSRGHQDVNLALR
jgi:hypothetical protein